MYEELFNTGEALRETIHPRIRAAKSNPIEPAEIESKVSEITNVVLRRDETALLEIFYALVPGYKCDKAAADSNRKNMDCLLERNATHKTAKGLTIHEVVKRKPGLAANG
jgi:hypothetical protein